VRHVIFLLAFILVFSASGQSNDAVSLNLENASYQSVFQTLTTLTGKKFAYNSDLIPDKPVNVKAEQEPLAMVLKKILGSELSYVERGHYIIIVSAEKPKKQVSVTTQGEILDADTHEELAEVSVYEVNRLTSAMTDHFGKYTLTATVPDEVAFIAISKANYQDTVIQVSAKDRFFTVLLKPIQEIQQQNPTDTLKLVQFFARNKVRKHANNVSLTERRLAQVSLTPGLSTNGFISGKISNVVSFNIIAGYAHSLHGVELGGFINMERMEGSGLQMAGAINIVGSHFHGNQWAGASNITLQDMAGFQAAGCSNHTKKVVGFQMAGVLNTASETRGLQMSGFANHTSGTLKGIQLAGFINRTGTLKGMQIGIVNLAKEVESGFSIGLINLFKDELHQLEASANDVTPYNLSFKSGLNHFYSIISAGIDPHAGQLWSYGLGFGTQRALNQVLLASTELSINTLQPLNSAFMDGFNSDLRWALRMGGQLTRKISIHGGPVLHYYFFGRHGQNPEFSHRFGTNALYQKTDGNALTKAWVGYEAAIRF